MLPIILCSVLLVQPEIEFADGLFTIKDGEDTITVPLSAGVRPTRVSADRMSIEVGGTLITFDQRGLGIQYGAQGGFTGLNYMPTTPKLFSRDEILANVEAIEAGERQFPVSAVSGFEVVDSTVYMLMRWDGSDGAPWLETLVRIDTSGDSPRVDLIGRFEGFTFTSGPVSDALHEIGGRLLAATQTEETLGIGEYEGASDSMLYRSAEVTVDDCRRLGTRFVTERSLSHGTTLYGTVDPWTAAYSPVLETRGELVDIVVPSALAIRVDRLSLHSVETGATTEVDDDAAFVETPMGVLTWSPAKAPERARLLANVGWPTLAEWSLPDGDGLAGFRTLVPSHRKL